MMRGAEQSSGAENAASRSVRRAILTAEVLFQGKWKLQILCAMRSGPVRFDQLARIRSPILGNGEIVRGGRPDTRE
jgi:DNA-binding HxlR family transcriptional regulator